MPDAAISKGSADNATTDSSAERLRKMEVESRRELEELLDVYKRALGMLV